MEVLVTGIGGFVGGHLVELLRAEAPHARVVGLVRPGLPAPAMGGEVRLLEAELEDAASVEAALEGLAPDRVIHLAAQSSVHRSFTDPEGTLRTNLHGLLHLLDALRRRSPAARILVVGSADEYGPAPENSEPLSEDAPLRPCSPYAVSKVAQGYLALQYALCFGMAIVRTRTFPHTGPGRPEAFAESSFARQVAEIEAGLRPPVLEVGNLDAVRDFSDVRDVVRAYWALLERGAAGEVYNVCSGRGVRIGVVLESLIARADVRVDVKVDASRLRPADVPALVGNPGRLQRATGWRPRYSLEHTLKDLLQDWRERVGASAARPGGGAP